MNLFSTICRSTWCLVSHFKQHLYSLGHQKKNTESFQKHSWTCNTIMAWFKWSIFLTTFLHHFASDYKENFRYWSFTFCMAASQASDCFLCSSGEGTTVSLSSSISSSSLYFRMRPLTEEVSKQNKPNKFYFLLYSNWQIATGNQIQCLQS